MDNYAINDPIEEPKSSGKVTFTPETLAQLLEFGFDDIQAKIALIKNVKID